MLKGIIIKNISNLYTVLSDNKRYDCTPRGVFRHEKITPLVGDQVLIEEESKQIIEILPRKNELSRPSVANVDYALIVTSLAHPDFSSFLLDKEIASVEYAGVKPCICFTKLDLVSSLEEYKKIKKDYQRIGIPCFDNQHIESLLSFLQNKVVVLTGQTGAGKSSLLNRINPKLELQTNEISESLNRGVHTTRHSEIYLEQGVWFLDTPGFSSFEVPLEDEKELSSCFVEFQDYPCKFRDCLHKKETSCGVKEAVEQGAIRKSRYENYLKILEGIENENRRFISKK